MAIAYKGAGAGTSTVTNPSALSPACPDTVDAGDILIAHVQYTGTSNAPSTPDGWTPLHGPIGVGTGTPTARTWCFGRIADGSEDGATVSFGSHSNTTMRLGRIYSFSGYVSGTIDEVCPAASFATNSSEDDPVIQAITTTIAGAKAIALVSQDDDNSHSGLGDVADGTWAEAVADFLVSGTAPAAGSLQLQVGTPTSDPGTISGGTVAGTNDESATICFEIRPNPPTPTDTAVGVISLEPGGTPDTQVDHSLFVRARKTAGGATTIRAALYEGASNRSGDLETTALTTSLADYELAIADANAEDITSYSNLEVRFWGYSSAASTSDVEVAEVWLQIPAGSGVTEHESSAAISATSAIASVPQRARLRSAALSAASSISSAATFYSTLERTAAISAASSVSSAATFYSTLERAAAISGASSVSSAAIFWSYLTGQAALSAATAVTSAGERELLRSVALAATGVIATSGTFWTTLERQAALAAASDIASAAEFSSTLERSAAVSAASAVTAAHERELQRQASLTAASSIASVPEVSGVHERSASLSAASAISSAQARTLQRQTSLTAASAIASVPQRDAHRSASLSAASHIEATGAVEGGIIVHQRSASVSASSSIASDGYSILERSAALAATGQIAAAANFYSTLERSAAVSATTSIASAGTYWTVHEKQAALAATSAISSAGEFIVERTAALAAVSGISTAHQRGLFRSAALTATSSIASSAIFATNYAQWTVTADSEWSQSNGTEWSQSNGDEWNHDDGDKWPQDTSGKWAYHADIV